jgi:hypothetical protein
VGTPQETNAKHTAAVALHAAMQRNEVFPLNQHLFMLVFQRYCDWDFHNKSGAMGIDAFHPQFNIE